MDTADSARLTAAIIQRVVCLRELDRYANRTADDIAWNRVLAICASYSFDHRMLLFLLNWLNRSTLDFVYGGGTLIMLEKDVQVEENQRGVNGVSILDVIRQLVEKYDADADDDDDDERALSYHYRALDHLLVAYLQGHD